MGHAGSREGRAAFYRKKTASPKRRMRLACDSIRRGEPFSE
ncbi:hypothetical protein IMCC9480_3992 [Oxalobacteraceae bacterium IMCC9480]|nr:hypothetical protein IMCC9480_3992 [Oxalobacteraceae bacterium IMCC9480]